MTGKLLAVDPGMRASGCAVFSADAKLIRAWLSKNPEKWQRGPICWTEMAERLHADLKDDGNLDLQQLVIECPQVYATKYQKGDQADIIQLACSVGAICARVPARFKTAYQPREWKGQTPKKIHNVRTLCLLSAEEKATIEPVVESLMHNIYDAIGLGLYQLKLGGLRV